MEKFFQGDVRGDQLIVYSNRGVQAARCSDDLAVEQLNGQYTGVVHACSIHVTLLLYNMYSCVSLNHVDKHSCATKYSHSCAVTWGWD